MTNPYPQTPPPSGTAQVPQTSAGVGRTPEYGQPQNVSSQWAPGQPPTPPQGYYPSAPSGPVPSTPSVGKARRGVVAAAGVGALIAVFAAGIGGVFVGSRLNDAPTASEPTTTAAPPPPTEAEVKAATVDLCTRFAAAYRAMPVPQNTGMDVIPTLNYIADALRDNTIADPGIHSAMEQSLKLFRDQTSYLMKNEAPRGAIQPATDWTPEASNAADQRVWDPCRAYGA